MLYEVLKDRADQFIAWSGQRNSSSAAERVNAEAALQAVIADQQWNAGMHMHVCILRSNESFQ